MLLRRTILAYDALRKSLPATQRVQYRSHGQFQRETVLMSGRKYYLSRPMHSFIDKIS